MNTHNELEELNMPNNGLFADADFANDGFAAADDEKRYNSTEGIPFAGAGCGGKRAERDYSSHAVNPPDAPAPCKNLRSEK
jgi:hypothetical protein